MANYTDQLGNSITLASAPARIVSLVPSQTELLYDLGLDDEIIAITRFCIHPRKWFKSKTKIGGTKTLHIEQIKMLQPDLIIANKEENVKEQIEALAADFPVWTSNICNLQQALQMIDAIGTITNCGIAAIAMIEKMKSRFAQLTAPPKKIRTAYLIWQHPYMTVGADTFIHDMLGLCGLENIFADRLRYPVINIEEIKERRCELLLLSSEPFPFKQNHLEALQQQIPETTIQLADGEIFSWYGSRLLLAPAYFKTLIKNC